MAQIPYQDLVKVLIHGNGNPGFSSDYVIQDECGHLLSARNGDTKNSTTQSKFNGSSLYFDGTGDYFTLASSNDFIIDTKDFTVSTFVFISGNSAAGSNGNRQAYIMRAVNDSFHLLEIGGTSTTTGTGFGVWNRISMDWGGAYHISKHLASSRGIKSIRSRLFIS